jgi:hypothetical protein
MISLTIHFEMEKRTVIKKNRGEQSVKLLCKTKPEVHKTLAAHSRDYYERIHIFGTQRYTFSLWNLVCGFCKGQKMETSRHSLNIQRERMYV